MRRSVLFLGVLAPVLSAALVGCPDPEEQPPLPRVDGGVDATSDVQPPAPKSWHTVASNLPEALLSVSGTSSSDVWVVGADKGNGPRVNHFDGNTWSTVATGQKGDLWWVHALPNKGPVFMAGASGMLLRYDGTRVERLRTPGLSKQTVFGVWAKAANDVYAVGSASGRDGFLWHYDGARVEQVRLPDNIPRLNGGEVPGLFKVWGEGEDVWVVGAAGTILHRKAGAPFTVVPSNTSDTLFTVHGAAGKVYAVGGASNGRALQINASDESVRDVSPPATALLQGVFATPNGVVASGERSLVYGFDAGSSTTFTPFAKGPDLSVQSFHAIYTAPEGDVWTVGGEVLSPALSSGGLAHYGEKPVPPLVAAVPDAGVDSGPVPVVCPADVVAAGANKSIARRWNEQILASIRRDIPQPTVHARNLYHLSAAIWDAYAAYDSTADGVFVRERLNAGDIDSARREAISYASYRVLSQRYAKAIGGAVSLACYRAVMTELGYDVNDTTDTGNTPRALGNRIGKAVLAFGNTDGANEAQNYADPSPYTSPNPPLVVDSPGITMNDPSVWQPLNLSVSATQNGIVLPAGVQGYIGSAWGGVTPFAMTRASALVPWHDPGPAPVFGAALVPSVIDVLRRSSQLDPNDGATIDISPGAYGNNPLGTNSGAGRAQNPITGQPYAPMLVKRGDFGRALAEFWADGPKSETPPGHWNALANTVTDTAGFSRKLFGTGVELTPLSYDVHMYLALNGALHDAAITAWDVKRRTVGARPIAFVRYMSSKGQSSDPNGPNYNASGMPLVPDLVELITAESSKPGQRHEHLSHFVGQIAIKTWRGEPGDHTTEFSGVGWVRGVDWMPYQRRNFVTPAFPGFVSGHSTFSRAAAEVLTSLTGSPFFPGGIAEFKCPQNKYLVFEIGPTTDVRLQWATYYDAADQAGQSRIWGGIHIEPDDFQGRKLGSLVGIEATARARTYFDGTAVP
jgi:hypothetical protein